MASYGHTTRLGGSPHQQMSSDVVRQPWLTGVVSSRYLGWRNTLVQRRFTPSDAHQTHAGLDEYSPGS